MTERTEEFVRRAAHPRLRRYVTEYTGYHMDGFPPGVHAGLPSKSLTFIIAIDEPLHVEHQRLHGRTRSDFWGMIGGLHQVPALVHHNGRQVGIQLDLVPQGAQALFGIPAASLAHDAVSLDSVAAGVAKELVDRLNMAVSWSARWAILDDVLLRSVSDFAGGRSEVEAMWSILVSSHGTAGVGEIAEELGWSRRHLSKHFASTFGVTPKTMARIIRFERAQRLIRLPTQPSLSSVAHICGYADQAHMTRDWAEFAGSSPIEWLTDETIPILQDPDHIVPSS